MGIMLHVLIIDEVSMLSKKVFELLDMIAKKVRKNPLLSLIHI